MSYIPALPLPGNVNISFGSEIKTTYKVLKAQFGDGYAQRSGDGLNKRQGTISVSIINLTVVEARVLTTFFDERGGYRSFSYQTPDDFFPRLWVCETHSLNYVDANIRSITATWSEVFVP